MHTDAYVGAYGCMTDACECTRMHTWVHTDASRMHVNAHGCIRRPHLILGALPYSRAPVVPRPHESMHLAAHSLLLLSKKNDILFAEATVHDKQYNFEYLPT